MKPILKLKTTKVFSTFITKDTNHLAHLTQLFSKIHNVVELGTRLENVAERFYHLQHKMCSEVDYLCLVKNVVQQLETDRKLSPIAPFNFPIKKTESPIDLLSQSNHIPVTNNLVHFVPEVTTDPFRLSDNFQALQILPGPLQSNMSHGTMSQNMSQNLCANPTSIPCSQIDYPAFSNEPGTNLMYQELNTPQWAWPSDFTNEFNLAPFETELLMDYNNQLPSEYIPGFPHYLPNDIPSEMPQLNHPNSTTDYNTNSFQDPFHDFNQTIDQNLNGNLNPELNQMPNQNNQRNSNQEIINNFDQTNLDQVDLQIPKDSTKPSSGQNHILHQSLIDQKAIEHSSSSSSVPTDVKPIKRKKTRAKSTPSLGQDRNLDRNLSHDLDHGVNSNQDRGNDTKEDNKSEQCQNCHVTSTPLWRYSSDGTRLCNACGLYYKLHKLHRPITAKSFKSNYKPRKLECVDCGGLETSLWRKKPGTDQPICNSCGLYRRIKHEKRPAHLYNGSIKKRQRNYRHPSLPESQMDSPSNSPTPTPTSHPRSLPVDSGSSQPEWSTHYAILPPSSHPVTTPFLTTTTQAPPPHPQNSPPLPHLQYYDSPSYPF